MTADFEEILRLWDLQQNYHVKYREERYSAMFELIEASSEGPYRILDLASGPGSLSIRFLEKYPDSETVMMDQDPVLLRISKENFKKISGKHSWVTGDISQPSTFTPLAQDSFDAVMTTTALHWLSDDALLRVYGQSFRILKHSGIFLNGDLIHSKNDSEEFNQLEKKASEVHTDKVEWESVPDWDEFWRMISETPDLSEEWKSRNEVYPQDWDHRHRITLESHCNYLEEVGFSVPGVVWSNFSDRILMARKP